MNWDILTALHVFISTLFLRCSSTLSRFPARAARRNDVFPSDCKVKSKYRHLFNQNSLLTIVDFFTFGFNVLLLSVSQSHNRFVKRMQEIVSIQFKRIYA